MPPTDSRERTRLTAHAPYLRTEPLAETGRNGSEVSGAQLLPEVYDQQAAYTYLIIFDLKFSTVTYDWRRPEADEVEVQPCTGTTRSRLVPTGCLHPFAPQEGQKGRFNAS